MELANIVLPVFLVIALGYALRRLGLIPEQVNSGLTKLVFYVAAPALLFRGTSQTHLDWSVSAPMLLVVGCVAVIVSFSVYATCARWTPERRGVMAQGSQRSNIVFLGLPLVLSAFGEEALGHASVLIAFMVIFDNMLAVVQLTLPHEGNRQLRIAVLAGTRHTCAIKNDGPM